MPTYQYLCTACERPLEAVQSFSDPALTTCPECDGALRKVFSGVGVVFKGAGFYRTDSRGSASVASPSSGEAKGGEKAPAKESAPPKQSEKSSTVSTHA